MNRTLGHLIVAGAALLTPGCWADRSAEAPQGPVTATQGQAQPPPPDGATGGSAEATPPPTPAAPPAPARPSAGPQPSEPDQQLSRAAHPEGDRVPCAHLTPNGPEHEHDLVDCAHR